MKTIELQQVEKGGLGGALTHYFADGKRIERGVFNKIKNEAAANGKMLNDWQSNKGGVVTFGQYVSVVDTFVY